MISGWRRNDGVVYGLAFGPLTLGCAIAPPTIPLFEPEEGVWICLDSGESYVTPDGRTIGGVVMEMKNITLRFGGVVAIKDISFRYSRG